MKLRVFAQHLVIYMHVSGTCISFWLWALLVLQATRGFIHWALEFGASRMQRDDAGEYDDSVSMSLDNGGFQSAEKFAEGQYWISTPAQILVGPMLRCRSYLKTYIQVF